MLFKGLQVVAFMFCRTVLPVTGGRRQEVRFALDSLVEGAGPSALVTNPRKINGFADPLSRV
jgi:hypothetical protein